jgi:hypothetical protein
VVSRKWSFGQDLSWAATIAATRTRGFAFMVKKVAAFSIDFLDHARICSSEDEYDVR